MANLRNTMNTKQPNNFIQSLVLWFDTYQTNYQTNPHQIDKSIDWARALPFIALHVACLLVFVVGWSPIAITVAISLYFIRMFAITAFYHRYFSHKTFKTSRTMQFLFAGLGASAVQRGALWWAAHHRVHHATADKEDDQHSPKCHGFLWSHMGWFLAHGNFSTREKYIRDFAKYPELRFLDRFDAVVPLIFAAALYAIGALMEAYAPSWGTNGLQMLIWGFVISTVVLYHGTFTINSLAHLIGKKVFPGKDDSRNNFWLAIITMGEGWHNNHHYYPGSARQGFLWWEIDLTYYGLVILEKLGLIWDLRPVPKRVLEMRQQS